MAYSTLSKIHLCISLGAKIDGVNLPTGYYYESQGTCLASISIAIEQ